jgi:hypothetical protein
VLLVELVELFYMLELTLDMELAVELAIEVLFIDVSVPFTGTVVIVTLV